MKNINLKDFEIKTLFILKEPNNQSIHFSIIKTKHSNLNYLNQKRRKLLLSHLPANNNRSK